MTSDHLTKGPLLVFAKLAQVLILLVALGVLGYGAWRLVDELAFRLASAPAQGEVVAFREHVETQPSPGASEHWRKDVQVTVRHPVFRFRSPVDGRLHRFVSRYEAPDGEEVGAAVAIRASTRWPEEGRDPHAGWRFLLPGALLLGGLLAILLVVATWRMPGEVRRAELQGSRREAAEDSPGDAAGEESLLRALWPAAILAVVALSPTLLRLAGSQLSPVVPGILLLDAEQLVQAMRAEPPSAGGPLLSQAEVWIARLPLLGRKAAGLAVVEAIRERRHEDLRRYLAAQRDPALRFPVDLERVPLLSAAVDARDVAAVQLLLEAGLDPRRDPWALARAVDAGQAELLRLLAAHGAAPADPDELRGLAGAALAGNDDATLLALVQLGWADREPFPPSERSLLDRALVRGLVRSSAELQRRGFASSAPLFARLVQGDLAGMRAVSPERDWLGVRIDEAPLLPFAAQAGQLAVVRRLVELGADPAASAAVDHEPERTALDLAAERGHLDVVRYLAGLPGARTWLEPREDRESPVTLAAAAGRWDVVEALIEAGASPNTPLRAGPSWGETPLHFAAREGNVAAVAYLLGHGADPGAEAAEKLLPIEVAEVPAVRAAIEQAARRAPGAEVR